MQLQLGLVPDQPLVLTEETRSRALAGSSGSALAWNTAKGRPYPDNGWRYEKGAAPGDPQAVFNTNRFATLDKPLGALRGLLAAGAGSDLIVDMQDRRLREVALPDGRLHPVFAFNRAVGDPGRVLWPLPGYHDIGSPGFLGPADWTDVAWAKKAPRIAWRGNLNGRADWHGEVRREGLRLGPLMRKYKSGEISERKARRTLEQFPRHRLMHRYIDDPRFDIGFTGADRGALEDLPFMPPYLRPRLSQQEARLFRYILVLPGMDVGSSFYWTMNSGSLALVMEGVFETFASGHFRPWQHYVPFRRDLADLEERIDWCLSHDADCRQMAEAARALCALLARRDLRDEIGRRVVAGLTRAIDAGAG